MMKNYAAIFMTMILALIFSGAAHAAPPVNDNYLNATPIVLESGVGGSVITGNYEATKEANEKNHAGNAGGHSVWFKVETPVSKGYRINVTDTNFNTLLAVYTGGDAASAQLVSYNDDCSDSCGGASGLDVMLHGGLIYYIAVDGYNNNGISGEGVFKLSLLEASSPYIDDYSPFAYQLKTNGGSIGGTNFGATAQPSEPSHYGGEAAARSVWYRWKPTASYAAKVETHEFQGSFSLRLAVYTSNAQSPTFAQLTKVRDTIDIYGYESRHIRLSFFAEAGKTYYIAVDGPTVATPGNSAEGNFQLTWGKNPIRYSGDFERFDIRSAVAVFRPSNGTWYYAPNARNNYSESVQWGQSGDTPVAADYDGDGETDIAVARNANGVKNWYVRNAAGIAGLSWGLATDRAIVGDFDGDGRADVGVMRLTSNGYAWYIRQSTNGAMRSFLFGTTGDRPVFGDFDGDGMTEVAVVRNGQNGLTWYMLKSSTNYQQFAAQQFGTATDALVAEDYDGDGTTDVAVFRPSTGYWYILQSSNGALDYKVFGASGDKPQPADYDGDGKADVGVFRPSAETWYMLQSGNAQAIIKPWGAATDIPVSSLTTLSQ